MQHHPLAERIKLLLEDIFGLSRDNHEIKWTKESFDEGLRTNNAENHRLLKEGQQYISEEKNFLALGLLEEEEDREKPFYEDAQSFNIVTFKIEI
ncbi:PREDICTED: uncharacterized protein LOC105146130 isoform X2 [Acromyrmex echinatior]|uniref:uncharacterized protein LOC105146130 isoform X2 n=1 Tax=Acromyrmex echinatior TaxID=103372 RepID=UPI000580BBDA|nr:PREDICTED: uncharacterized protein LOC105146130 isoform X2 [Acromyrmex echinatior]